MKLDQKIEGVLFYKASPMKKKGLLDVFSISEEELSAALATLAARLDTSGMRLLETDKEVSLVTAPELDEIIETMRKDELKRDIGKAGAETLAIILYREPVSRAEIDMIRGVNSAFILRNLLIRGLISREANPNDTRSFRYRITPELLKHLGITKKTELSDFQTISDTLDRYQKEQAEQKTGATEG